MKGKHYVSIEKKNGWFTVYVNSEVINAKEPRAKFIDEGDALEWADGEARYLSVGLRGEK